MPLAQTPQPSDGLMPGAERSQEEKTHAGSNRRSHPLCAALLPGRLHLYGAVTIAGQVLAHLHPPPHPAGLPYFEGLRPRDCLKVSSATLFKSNRAHGSRGGLDWKSCLGSLLL